MSTFLYQIKVHFADVDPAGIMFYPRIFEMVNETIEEWFSSIGFSFSKIHLEDQAGIPLVKIEASFHKPSHLGEVLDFELGVEHVGGSSLALKIKASGGSEDRFEVKAIAAHIDLNTKKATPWPKDLKTELEKWQE
ncbi:MAG: thioesterase family protein [Sphingomonadales bacterium]